MYQVHNVCAEQGDLLAEVLSDQYGSLVEQYETSMETASMHRADAEMSAHQLSELLDEREFLLAELDMTFALYRTLRTMLKKQRGYALAKGIEMPDTSQLRKDRQDEARKAQAALRQAQEQAALAASKAAAHGGDGLAPGADGDDSDLDDDDDEAGAKSTTMAAVNLFAGHEDELSDVSSQASAATTPREVRFVCTSTASNKGGGGGGS